MARRKSIVVSLRRAACALLALGSAFLVGTSASPLNAAPRTLQPRCTDVHGTVWVFFIDDLHLDFVATGHLKKLFRMIFDGLVEEGDCFAAVSDGPSSIAIDLTRDRNRSIELLQKFSGSALRPSEILIIPDQDSSEVRFRAHLAFATVYDVVKNVAGIPASRKGVIYISNGYFLEMWAGGVRAVTANPFTIKGNGYSLERLRGEVAELVAQAARSNATIYAVDPRALSGEPVRDPALNNRSWQKYWTTTKDSLHVIADQTGGFVLDDDVENGLAKIAGGMPRH